MRTRVNTRHFSERFAERAAGLSARRRRKFDVLYNALRKGTANTTSLHGRYAVQFGGPPGGKGDYIVVNITGGRVDGFISLLIDQSVIMTATTAIIPSSKVLPMANGRSLANPKKAFLKHIEEVEAKLDEAREAAAHYRQGDADELDVLNAFSTARKAMDRLLLEILEK